MKARVHYETEFTTARNRSTAWQHYTVSNFKYTTVTYGIYVLFLQTAFKTSLFTIKGLKLFT